LNDAFAVREAELHTAEETAKFGSVNRRRHRRTAVAPAWRASSAFAFARHNCRHFHRHGLGDR
jgi:hypothetical protein